MVRRTPFYAHLTNIVSKNRSCPSGSSMVAGKCVTDSPVAEKKSITLGSARPTQTIFAMGRSISSDQMSAIKEKISAMSLPETSPGNVHIGSGRSTSGVLPTRSPPNAVKPDKYVPVTEAKPLKVVGSGSTAIIPIKM